MITANTKQHTLSQEDGYALLAEAVFLRALDDWRSIKQGLINETATCNLNEIRLFLRSEWAAAIWPGENGAGMCDDMLRHLESECYNPYTGKEDGSGLRRKTYAKKG